ncbi:MAG: TetR/AcrR family transcriptional regulator [Acidimicrobiales bacterium]|nr:TetR/AcrR family transcriptional regulator [Acidimicrobiales bacterium]
MSEPIRLPRLPDRRRRPVGEERREAILAAIEDLLQERSLADISVGDIASAAGVGRSGFYFYFANKGAAVTAMLGDMLAEMLAGATAFMHGGELSSHSVRIAIHATWEAWRQHQGLILAMLDARGSDASVRELWDGWIERFVIEVGDAVLRRRRARQADDGLDERELLHVLMAANERTFERLSRTGADHAHADRAVEALVALWSQAINGRYEPRTDS